MTDPSPTTQVSSAPSPESGAGGSTDDAPLVETELLVEDVSIDGMCGVY
ncbi:MAG: mycofactocin precursor MftA [Acidimicrobiales bacterium]